MIRNMIILLVFAATVLSCSTSEEIDPCEDLTKQGDWELIVEGQEVETFYFSCYDRWGVKYRSGELFQGLLVDDFPSDLMQDSITVFVCGYARTNEIPLVFPDPSFSNVYQFEAVRFDRYDR